MNAKHMEAVRSLLKPAALCLLLAACSSGEGGAEEGAQELSAADASKASAMLQEYQAARGAGNPEGAEAAADRLRERYPDSAAAQQLDASLAEVRQGAQALRETRRLRGLWDYQQIAVGSGTQRSASISSKTAEAGEDQPAPLADAQLVLRDHPEWGRSAYLLLAQSKFDCGKPCAMRIAFDEAPAETWAGKQADSGKGPALFIQDQARFIKSMSAAKQVRIELPKGSGHIASLLFEVGGFAPSSYPTPEAGKS